MKHSFCQGCIQTNCDMCAKLELYQQGRADAEKELQGLKDLGKLYSEIRAEVIDEFVSRLINIRFPNTISEVEESREYKDIILVANELKEQI